MSPQFCIAKYSPELQKLSKLRAKTDRQVLDFIESKLEAALRFITIAESEFSEENRTAAQESLGLADQAIGEAQTLLVVFDEQERRGLERKLSQATRSARSSLPRSRIVTSAVPDGGGVLSTAATSLGCRV
jgi:hypothetical protein